MKYLFATTNKAKIRRYAKELIKNGIEIVTLDDLNINIDVNETGNNSVENAIIKATEYNKISDMVTIAMDDELFLYNVPDEIQPGTHVRRVKGKRLNDQEMIEHYISLVNKYGVNGELLGYFRKGVAVVNKNDIYTYEHKSDRKFTNKKSEVIDKGYPLASIQLVEPFGKFKSELTKEEEEKVLNAEQRDILSFILDTINIIEEKEKEGFDR